MMDAGNEKLQQCRIPSLLLDQNLVQPVLGLQRKTRAGFGACYDGGVWGRQISTREKGADLRQTQRSSNRTLRWEGQICKCTKERWQNRWRQARIALQTAHKGMAGKISHIVIGLQAEP